MGVIKQTKNAQGISEQNKCLESSNHLYFCQDKKNFLMVFRRPPPAHFNFNFDLFYEGTEGSSNRSTKDVQTVAVAWNTCEAFKLYLLDLKDL